jgi:hypothetical protein
VKFTFWHTAVFAWFCNMAMHIGMSDPSVLRFARKSWCAIVSGAGMYSGHFMAWLAALVFHDVLLVGQAGFLLRREEVPNPGARGVCPAI